MKLVDKREKIKQEEFNAELSIMLGNKSDIFSKMLKTKNLLDFTSILPKEISESEGVKDIQNLINKLNEIGIKMLYFRQTW